MHLSSELSVEEKLRALHRYLFARPALVKFHTWLLGFSLKGLGVTNCAGSWATGEEYLIKKALPKLLNTDRPVMFDVGANVGNYSDSLLKQFPNASIYAFEPHPRSYSLLCSRIVSPKSKFYNIAIAERPGSLVLYDRSDCDGSVSASLFKDVISDLLNQAVVEHSVQVKTLDEIADEEDIQYIDFLKLDIEGGELAALKGASNLINSKSIGCIQFEFNEMNVVSRAFFRDFRIVLNDYSFYRLLPRGLIPLDGVSSPRHTELFGYQNIVAIPSERARLLES